MDLSDIYQRHETPQFPFGTELMWCDGRSARPTWQFGTVIGSGYHQHLYGTKGERRVEYLVWRDAAGDGKEPTATLVPDHTVIVKAGRDPYRECWEGVVELTKVWQMQLFSYDWELDGNDTDVVVRLLGRHVGDSTSNHATEAVLVLHHTDRVQVHANVYTLWDWGTGARDLAALP